MLQKAAKVQRWEVQFRLELAKVTSSKQLLPTAEHLSVTAHLIFPFGFAHHKRVSVVEPGYKHAFHVKFNIFPLQETPFLPFLH